MPDLPLPTAPVAAEGSTQTPEPVPQNQPAEKPTSRAEQIAEWLKAPRQVTPAPAEAKVEDVAIPAAAPEPEAQEDLSQPSTTDLAAMPPDLGKAVRRIRLLKEERKELKAGLTEAEARIRALEAETESLRKQTQPTTPASFDAVEDLGELEKAAKISGDVFRWADKRLDRVVTEDEAAKVGAELEAEGLPVPEEGWTVQNVRKPLLDLKESGLRKFQAAQQRTEWLKTEEVTTQQAAELVPELTDEKNPLAEKVREVVASRPWLRRLPDWPLLATVAALGLQELERRKQPASAKPAATPSAPPPKAPVVPGAPRRATPEPTNRLEELRKKANAKGASPEDRRAWIKESLLQGTSGR